MHAERIARLWKAFSLRNLGSLTADLHKSLGEAANPMKMCRLPYWEMRVEMVEVIPLTGLLISAHAESTYFSTEISGRKGSSRDAKQTRRPEPPHFAGDSLRKQP